MSLALVATFLKRTLLPDWKLSKPILLYELHKIWMPSGLRFPYPVKKTFMTPFYGWGSTASRLEPLWGESLLFTVNFP